MTNKSISGLGHGDVRAMAVKLGTLALLLLIGGCGTYADSGSGTEALYKPRHPADPERRCKGPAASEIEIHFTDGCPTSVSVELDSDQGGKCPENAPANSACVKLDKKDRFIRWVTGDPAITNYSIIFDPFVGPLEPRGAQGCLRMKLDPSTPSNPDGLVYKYSIMRTAVNTGQDCILDPQIIVQP